MLKLSTGRRTIPIPASMCTPEDVHRAVSKACCPFVVKTGTGGFTVKPRVFLITDPGARVECNDEQELWFACRLLAEEHNLEQTMDETLECIHETQAMEEKIQAFMDDPEQSEDERVVDEEDDISIQDWSQMGYKWFKQDDIFYI